MGLVWLLLLVGLAPLFRPSLFPRALLLIIALDQLSDSILITFVSGLNISARTGQASRVLLLARIGRLVGALFLVIGIQAQNPFYLAFLRLLATLLGGGLGLWLLRPDIRFSALVEPVETLRSSFTYGMAELLSLIYAQADVTLLGIFVPIKRVGEYSPAVSLINALTVVPSSFFYIFVPTLTHTFLTAQITFANAAKRMVLTYSGVGIALATGTALILSPLIIIFLGHDYAVTGRLVLLMSPIPFLKSISFIGATFLVVVGKQEKRIRVQLISALLNVGLNVIFIPVFGPFGAAAIYLFSELVLAIGYLLTARFYYSRMVIHTQPSV
jgi:O-antigen/teichoic acid export membrane protein